MASADVASDDGVFEDTTEDSGFSLSGASGRTGIQSTTVAANAVRAASSRFPMSSALFGGISRSSQARAAVLLEHDAYQRGRSRNGGLAKGSAGATCTIATVRVGSMRHSTSLPRVW
jgi:hypothetical protein